MRDVAAVNMTSRANSISPKSLGLDFEVSQTGQLGDMRILLIPVNNVSIGPDFRDNKIKEIKKEEKSCVSHYQYQLTLNSARFFLARIG